MPKFVVVDTEGSGLFDYAKPADADGQPRLAAVTLICTDADLNMESEETLFVKPDGWVMAPEAEAVNGLSTDFLLANGKPVGEVLDRYAALLDEGRAVVAFGAQHDMKQMRAELRRAGRPDRFDSTANVCVMRCLVGVCKIPQANGRGYKWPKLHEAMAHFHLPLSGKSHGDGGKWDARDTLVLARRCRQIGVLPEPSVHLAKDGTKAGRAKAAREAQKPLAEALAESAALVGPQFCTYPQCKCIVSTSTSQPWPICPLGLEIKPAEKPLAQQDLPL